MAPTLNGKRKHAARKTTEPIIGDWDVLPHGLGKSGDLLEGAATSQPPSPKRSRRTRASIAARDAKGKSTGDEAIAVVQVEGVDFTKNGKGRKFVRGRAKKSELAKPESSRASEPHDALTSAPLKFEPTKPVIKSEMEDVDAMDVQYLEEAKLVKQPRKKKHPYGLTPGFSSFPNHEKPTPEDCEEVTQLLSELHGQVKPPDVIPPPSLSVAGCGEVPDLLDAVMRTLLSASTSASNANLSLRGLKDTFGLRTFGKGKDSVNWEAVHRAELQRVIEAIRKGGLAERKGAYIKNILDAVHDENCTRRDALLKERVTGKPASISGAKNETEEQKDSEILIAEESLLSLDYVFEMTTDEAMDELTKLPGIGVKTASCVILFCMKRPSFAVDTHVWRHCKWLGWVPEKATRDQTFSHCEVRIPDHLKYPLHHLFLRHGKTCGRCRANTSAGTEEWNNTVCPIDHLVQRNEKRKIAGQSRAKKIKGSKKSKKVDDETEESDVEMEVTELDEEE